ncbi:hypothetical protein Tco_0634772 [Tanacetum coccineum]
MYEERGELNSAPTAKATGGFESNYRGDTKRQMRQSSRPQMIGIARRDTDFAEDIADSDVSTTKSAETY